DDLLNILRGQPSGPAPVPPARRTTRLGKTAPLRPPRKATGPLAAAPAPAAPPPQPGPPLTAEEIAALEAAAGQVTSQAAEAFWADSIEAAQAQDRKSTRL